MSQRFDVVPAKRPSLWRRAIASIRSYVVEPISMSDSALADLLFAGRQTASGVNVDVATAFTVSAVYDAVNQIASDIAKLPLNLHKRRPAGGSDVFADSPLQRLLKLEPNPEMGSMVFRRQIMVWALTAKGGFAEIQRNGMGQPVALWPIHPSRVTPYRARLRDGGYGPLSYQIDGGKTTIEPEDMIHIAGIGDDPHCAYPLVEKARQAIGLALAAEQFGATFFGNGSTFGGILTTDITPTEEEAKRMKLLIEQIHKGPERAHQLAALWGGWKLQPLGVKPNEGQMNELRSKQVEEVARFFNLPVHKLKNLDRATNNNIEQQDLEYYKGCLLTWITLIEEEFNRKLIPAVQSRRQFIKHNANAFLRGDTKSRFEAYEIGLRTGLYNRNEIRELEDLNPLPDGQGDLYLVQAGQVNLQALSAPIAVEQPPDVTTEPTARRKVRAQMYRDALAAIKTDGADETTPIRVLAYRVVELAQAANVELVWAAQGTELRGGLRTSAMADLNRRVACVPPITSTEAAAKALHEIGHLVVDGLSGRSVLEVEVAAWQWAARHALVWDTACEELLSRSLRSYSADARQASPRELDAVGLGLVDRLLAPNAVAARAREWTTDVLDGTEQRAFVTLHGEHDCRQSTCPARPSKVAAVEMVDGVPMCGSCALDAHVRHLKRSRKIEKMPIDDLLRREENVAMVGRERMRRMRNHRLDGHFIDDLERRL